MPLRACMSLLLLLALAACSSLQVETRPEPGFDYATLRSWAFAADLPRPGTARADKVSPETASRLVREALSRELEGE